MRTLAVHLPRARLVDGLAVHLHPRSYAIQHCNFFAVDGAVGSAGDIEDEGPVLAGRINEPTDDGCRRQIATELAKIECRLEVQINRLGT